MNKLFLAFFFLVACAREDEPIAAAPAAASTGELRSLLTARHPKDLPGKAALVRHPGAVETLRELAWHDDKLMIRRRAADTLGVLAADDPVAEKYLVELLDAPEATTRAGALHGLGRLDLAARPELRARIEAHVDSPDLQVAFAAVGALDHDSPVLTRVADGTALDPRVRQLAARRLGRGGDSAPPVMAVPAP
jgi:hypothetical protein